MGNKLTFRYARGCANQTSVLSKTINASSMIAMRRTTRRILRRQSLPSPAPRSTPYGIKNGQCICVIARKQVAGSFICSTPINSLQPIKRSWATSILLLALPHLISARCDTVAISCHKPSLRGHRRTLLILPATAFKVGSISAVTPTLGFGLLRLWPSLSSKIRCTLLKRITTFLSRSSTAHIRSYSAFGSRSLTSSPPKSSLSSSATVPP